METDKLREAMCWPRMRLYQANPPYLSLPESAWPAWSLSRLCDITTYDFRDFRDGMFGLSIEPIGSRSTVLPPTSGHFRSECSEMREFNLLNASMYGRHVVERRAR